jgi:hypothetical protein
MNEHIADGIRILVAGLYAQRMIATKNKKLKMQKR